MSIVTLNRILLLLGILGLFVAGVLSAEHIWHLAIPCTTGGGCQTVAQHPSSYIARIPVAYFGLAGYLILTAIAIVRGYTGQYYNRNLTLLGYLGSAFGMIFSLYLQYISFTVINAKCIWCMTSAGIMVLTFIFYTMLFGRLGSPEAEAEPVTSPQFLYIGLAGVLLASFAVAGVRFSSGIVGNKMALVDAAKVAKLVPEPKSERHQLGPDDAPVTLVEFADLCCPQCREGFPQMHKIIAKYPGKIRLVYRHFPIYQLPGHEMSLQAVITSELADQKGKFWEFADAFTAAEEAPTTIDGLVAISSRFGITEEDIDKAMKDDNSIPNKRLTRDFTDVHESFMLKSTPTFMLMVKDQPVKQMSLAQVMKELDSAEMQKILKP